MSKYRIEVEGREEMEAKLARIGGAVAKTIAKNAVDEGAAVIQFHAQLNARNVFSSRQTGALRNSIRTESRMTATGAEAEVGPHVVYARIQEFGGTIRPVRASRLHFQIDGRDIFAKQVTIPARPYMRPAVQEHIGEISSAMRSAIDDGIQKSA